MPCSTRFDVAVVEAQVDLSSGCSRMKRSTSGTSTRRPNATEVLMRSCAAAPATAAAPPGCRPPRARARSLALLVVERADLGRASRRACCGAAAARPAAPRAAATCLVAVGWVMPRSAEALLKLPVSTTRTKSCTPVMRSMARIYADAAVAPGLFRRGIALMPPAWVLRPGARRRPSRPAIRTDRRHAMAKMKAVDGRRAGDGKGRHHAGLRRARRRDQPAVRGAARARQSSPTSWRATSKAPRTWPRATRAPRPATSACASAPPARPAPT